MNDNLSARHSGAGWGLRYPHADAPRAARGDAIDITHRCFAGDALVRLAVGRDYASAAPVRGVRYGGGAETLEVRVNMRPLQPHGAEDASR